MLKGEYSAGSPLDSASVPSITVSPASCSLKDKSLPSGNDDGQYHGILKGNSSDSGEKSRTMVSFASSALLVEANEPPSATSSDTLPSPKVKSPIRRGSGHIKISSVPAHDGGEHTKHTLKGRPLTPFVKFDATAMEEPLTAQVISEFDVMNGLPSPFAKTSVEGSVNGLDVSPGDIESVTFYDAGAPAKVERACSHEQT
ncbi:hypothetical protein QFC19_001640 [Naganishia cerealis]|uniref:Uncharacterized protein n=1 Tax=Naganishia cerealis TaxID=610337 RepID=A0ACC2WI45_9TREE|nr:hypothetical protein QFC19_001640 [Naganishia cerealis]